MSAVDTLVSVVVGAIIGFFGSIGFGRWKQQGDKKELKDRKKRSLRLSCRKSPLIVRERHSRAEPSSQRGLLP
jgi:hypothetical protein